MISAWIRPHCLQINGRSRRGPFGRASIGKLFLGQHGPDNRGSLVLGIEPQHELPGLQLTDQIVSGNVFEPGSDQVVVSEGLAEFLKVVVGDSLLF